MLMSVTTRISARCRPDHAEKEGGEEGEGEVEGEEEGGGEEEGEGIGRKNTTELTTNNLTISSYHIIFNSQTLFNTKKSKRLILKEPVVLRFGRVIVNALLPLTVKSSTLH